MAVEWVVEMTVVVERAVVGGGSDPTESFPDSPSDSFPDSPSDNCEEVRVVKGTVD